jgi:hypothetical protein
MAYYYGERLDVFYSAHADYSKMNLESACPSYFSAECAHSINRLKQVSRLKLIVGLILFRPTLIWKTSPFTKILTILPWVCNVDLLKNPNEGWRFIEFYNKLHGSQTRPYEFSNIKHNKVLVLGTGPSLDHAENIDVQDAAVIICNTMIKNKELMARVQPKFLVFADAIYHFGPSRYAAAFRDAFREFVGDHPACVVLLPEVFYGFFVDKLGSEFARNVYSIPEAGHRNIVVNLANDAVLHRFENILNKMLIPISCTLGKSVSFLGFDGRAKSDKGFWAHSSKNNFIELLPVQEQAHPSFFRKKSYTAYAEHQEQVTEMLLEAAEKAGVEVVCLAESNNSAMAKRYKAEALSEVFGA